MAKKASSQLNQTITMTASRSASESQVTRGAKPSRNKRLEFVKDEDALTAYLNDIKNAKTLTMAEEQILAARILKGDKKAIHILVEANLKFVVAVCRNYRYQGMSMGDLINEGNLGLIKAAKRFDASLNFKFISYAVWWIRQGILTALAEQSRVVNISPGRVGVIQKIGKASKKLSQTLGRLPTMGEVAEEMELTEKEVVECLHLASSPLSMNRPVGGEEDGNLEDCLPDTHSESTDDAALKVILSRSMEGMLGTLDDREEKVLRLFYGIGSQGTSTLKEIADRFDLTRERIRQIKEKALQKLRHPSRVNQLAAFRA